MRGRYRLFVYLLIVGLALPAVLAGAESYLESAKLVVEDGKFIYDQNKVGLNTATPQFSWDLHVPSENTDTVGLRITATGLWQTAGHLNRLEFRNGDSDVASPPGHQFVRVGMTSEGVNGTNSALYFSTQATGRMHIRYDGNVGIGVSQPQAALEIVRPDNQIAMIQAVGVNQGTGLLYLGRNESRGGGIIYNGDDNPNLLGSGDDVVFFRRNNGTDTNVFWYRYNNSTVHFVQAIDNGSDRRWKTDIRPLDDPLNRVLALQGVTYRYDVARFPHKGFSDRPQIGLIAQNVAAVFPELVFTDSEGFYQLTYDPLVSVLTEALKEQSRLLSEAEARASRLRERAESNRQRIQEQLKRLEALETMNFNKKAQVTSSIQTKEAL